jgi:hypothetical protein
VRRRQPKQMLQQAKAHFEVVADYGSGDMSDPKTVDAICLRLSAGIEALAGLGTADREPLFGGIWNQVWACATASPTEGSWTRVWPTGDGVVRPGRAYTRVVSGQPRHQASTVKFGTCVNVAGSDVAQGRPGADGARGSRSWGAMPRRAVGQPRPRFSGTLLV